MMTNVTYITTEFTSSAIPIAATTGIITKVGLVEGCLWLPGQQQQQQQQQKQQQLQQQQQEEGQCPIIRQAKMEGKHNKPQLMQILPALSHISNS